jgi:hypothetical protein
MTMIALVVYVRGFLFLWPQIPFPTQIQIPPDRTDHLPNEENGYTIAKVKVCGRRDLVTVVENLWLRPHTPGVYRLEGIWRGRNKKGRASKPCPSVIPAAALRLLSSRALSSGRMKLLYQVPIKNLSQKLDSRQKESSNPPSLLKETAFVTYICYLQRVITEPIGFPYPDLIDTFRSYGSPSCQASTSHNTINGT